MKKIIILGGLIIALFSTVALRGVKNYYADLFMDLGVQKAEANLWIADNIIDGGTYFNFTDQMKRLTPAQRTVVVTGLADYIRSYVESPEFANIYKEKRQELLSSVSPQNNGPSRDEMIAKILESLQNDERMIGEELKRATGSQKSELEVAQKEIKFRITVLKNPNHPQFGLYFSEMKSEIFPDLGRVGFDDPRDAQQAAEVEQEMIKDFERNFPPSPKALIAKRLKEFIDLSGTIDFDAKLRRSGDRLYFVDEKYEMKDPEWKRLYRCGREVILPARAYAQKWLASLK